MTQVLQVLSQQLQENGGNRITAALINGILLAVSQQIEKEKPEEPKPTEPQQPA